MLFFGLSAGFITDYIISPFWEVFLPAPNIAEGIIFWVLSLAMVYILFFIPYILFWGAVVAIVLYYRRKIKI